MRVGILGGGIAGLACAYYLSRSGDVPVVLAESPQLGDAGAPIVHRGVAIERVHDPILQGDTAVCGLLAQLGAAGRLIWRESRSVAPASRTLARRSDAQLPDALLRSTDRALRPSRRRGAEAGHGAPLEHGPVPRGHVEAVHVTREPLADPFWTRGYLAQKPPQRIGDTSVYLCSSAQTYPRVPSWDTGIGQARQTAGEIHRDRR